MSVITSWPAVSNRMIIVWSYLKDTAQKSLTTKELERLIAPESLGKGSEAQEDDGKTSTTVVEHVVNEMVAIGLLQRGEGGSVALAADAPDGDEEAFLTYMERILLHPIEAEKRGQKSFPMALAWFLNQNLTTPLVWGENHIERVQEDCGAESKSFELTNFSSCQQFFYWARYLGFAWHLNIGSNKHWVLPDPTLAIARHMPVVMGRKELRPIQDVISELGQLLPVLEGGTARGKVESLLPDVKQRPKGQLSQSTSLALERLEQSDQLSITLLADAPVVVNLDRASGLRPVSHLTWTGEDSHGL